MPPIDTNAATQNGQPGHCRSARSNKTREHDKFALGEIDRVSGLVDQYKSKRDQRVHQPDQHTIR